MQRIELLDFLEESNLGWFWATDCDGRIAYISPGACAHAGRSYTDIIGSYLPDIFAPDDRENQEIAVRPLSYQLKARNTITALRVRLQNAEKELCWEISGKPRFDKQGSFTGYRGTFRDISPLLDDEHKALANIDPLTGLANRRRMNLVLNKTLTAYRRAKRSCAVMMLDLERFKRVNDTLGHKAGDDLLKQVGMRLHSLVKRKGTIGRLGGDEFLIMLPDVEDRGELGDLARHIIQMISQPYSICGSRAIVGTSIGIAIAPYDGVDAFELTSAANLSLHAAKAEGRGQFRFFSSDLKDGAYMRREIEEELRDAIGGSNLEMFYQPIVATENNRATCMEALIRWKHVERGYISPATFIPIAEDLGFICELGQWILKRACADAAAWPVPLRVAVNVSALQFDREEFPSFIAETLRSTGLAPSRLELEITESVFLADAQRTQRIFEKLKSLGIRLALDDFGTGYSSLSYLQTAPFDKIKIDRSFVRGATEEGNNNAAILGAIVNLAEALDMETVAEGVETEDELALVKSHGASHVQGYIFSRPMGQEQIVERLEKQEIAFAVKGPPRFRSERRSLFRNVGVIYGDHRYNAVLRNLSKSGALIQGLFEMPVGTELVLDLGGGQLAVCVVVRSEGSVQGLQFETPLVSDGADGLCTRHRVSPYAIEAADHSLIAFPSQGSRHCSRQG